MRERERKRGEIKGREKEVGKSPQIFRPLLPAEYVTVFSGQTDAPEVRFDLTDRQTDRPNYTNPPAHAHRGLITDTTVEIQHCGIPVTTQFHGNTCAYSTL